MHMPIWDKAALFHDTQAFIEEAQAPGNLDQGLAQRKCCNFENGDGGGPKRNWAARSQAGRSNSWSMN